MDQRVILDIFKVGSIKLTLAEIEQIMDEEMEKDPSEMDCTLIELCLDILTNNIK